MSEQPELEDLFRMEAVIADIRKTSKGYWVSNDVMIYASRLKHMLDHGKFPPAPPYFKPKKVLKK